MDIASRARTGLALAACLALAGGANAAPVDLGSTTTPADPPATSSPLGDAGRTTYQPVPNTSRIAAPRPAGDDHARSTATTSTPVEPTGDDHARTDALTLPQDGTISVPVAPERVPAPPVSANSDGFDWSDAGIGFGTAMGFAFLAGGTMMFVRRSRSPYEPAI